MKVGFIIFARDDIINIRYIPSIYVNIRCIPSIYVNIIFRWCLKVENNKQIFVALHTHESVQCKCVRI